MSHAESAEDAETPALESSRGVVIPLPVVPDTTARTFSRPFIGITTVVLLFPTSNWKATIYRCSRWLVA